MESTEAFFLMKEIETEAIESIQRLLHEEAKFINLTKSK